MSDITTTPRPGPGEPRRRQAAARLALRFDEARVVAASTLSELLSEGVASPRELVDAIGVATLDHYLPPALRVRLIEAMLAEGRQGRPFDDMGLLRVLMPDTIARCLPLDKLRSVVETLCKRASGESEVFETLGEEDEAPISATPRPAVLPAGAPASGSGETIDLSPDSVDIVPSSAPPATPSVITLKRPPREKA